MHISLLSLVLKPSVDTHRPSLGPSTTHIRRGWEVVTTPRREQTLVSPSPYSPETVPMYRPFSFSVDAERYRLPVQKVDQDMKKISYQKIYGVVSTETRGIGFTSKDPRWGSVDFVRKTSSFVEPDTYIVQWSTLTTCASINPRRRDRPVRLLSQSGPQGYLRIHNQTCGVQESIRSMVLSTRNHVIWDDPTPLSFTLGTGV